jgi:hypothetical protein
MRVKIDLVPKSSSAKKSMQTLLPPPLKDSLSVDKSSLFREQLDLLPLLAFEGCKLGAKSPFSE